MRITGKYETIGQIKYFIPYNLPPENPNLIMDAETVELFGQAMNELGKLNEMSFRLPDQSRFLKAYIIKEALLSSSIEGINTTLLEVFTQSVLDIKLDKNTQLVINYTDALYKAIELVENKGIPILSRVILAAHEKLMEGEGNKANPGNYRTQSVKVGNLNPAPANKISELMSELETYINNDTTLPDLIKAGLAHVQFETIHPFFDGNGRIGRLLIVIMLINSNLLRTPILYPSYYFKKNHLDYYAFLDRVRTEGDFEGWIKFYLKVVRDSSIDAYKRANDINLLTNKYLEQITRGQKPTNSSKTRIEAFHTLFNYPIISITELSSKIGASYNTTNKIIMDFIDLGILVEETHQKRGRLFRFKSYFDILEKEY